MTVEQNPQNIVITTEMAKGYFENMRRYMCEEHLKLCPKGTVAYYATLKEKEFYDMAIKALEETEKVKAQINSIFQKATDKMKAKNDHDEQLLDYAERLQDECKDLQRRNEDLSKCVELWMESNCKTREAIKKAREEIDGYTGVEVSGVETIPKIHALGILEKYLGEGAEK